MTDPIQIANDIKAAILELAEGRDFPDLLEAIDSLAALAEPAVQPEAPAVQDPPDGTWWPTNRYLFRHMCKHFGIELGNDTIDEAFAKIHAAPRAEPEAPAVPSTGFQEWRRQFVSEHHGVEPSSADAWNAASRAEPEAPAAADELMTMIDAYAFGYPYKNTPGVRRDELKVAIAAALAAPRAEAAAQHWCAYEHGGTYCKTCDASPQPAQAGGELRAELNHCEWLEKVAFLACMVTQYPDFDDGDPDSAKPMLEMAREIEAEADKLREILSSSAEPTPSAAVSEEPGGVSSFLRGLAVVLRQTDEWWPGTVYAERLAKDCEKHGAYLDTDRAARASELPRMITVEDAASIAESYGTHLGNLIAEDIRDVAARKAFVNSGKGGN